MSNPQKTEIINDLTQKFQNSSGIYFTKYSGMNVAQATELRKQFKESEVSYFVSKNTLTKIAANNAGFENKLDGLLSGQIGIAYVAGDPTAPARVIRNLKKKIRIQRWKLLEWYLKVKYSAQKNTKSWQTSLPVMYCCQCLLEQ